MPPERAEREHAYGVHDFGAGHNPCQRGAVADTFGEGEHVWYHIVGLIAPEVFAGSSPAGLYLIHHEQDLMVGEHLVELTEETVGRGGEASNTLNRLGDQTRNITGSHHVDHLHEIVNAGVGEVFVVHVAERAAQTVTTLDEVHRQAREAS